MDYLQKNLERGYAKAYKEELENEFYDQNFELEQIYYNEINFNAYKVVYIAIDMIDIKKIKEILMTISKESLIFFWYRELVLLRLVLGRIDFAAYNKNVCFVQAKIDDKNSLIHFNLQLSAVVYAMDEVVPIIFQSNDREYIRDTSFIIKYANKIRDYSSMMFELGDAYVYISYRNALLNIPILMDKVSTLDVINMKDNPFKGKPAVMVAAGPSLDKNVEVLKKLENKAFIFACDAAITTLKKAGITPEFNGILEFQDDAYKKFFKGKELSSYTRLLAHILASPDAIAQAEDNILIHGVGSEERAVYFQEFIDREMSLSNGGASVAHYLVDAAYYLGCDPVIVIGQDLCFADDGSTHADDSETKFQEDVNSKSFFKVKGNYEEEVLTYRTWASFLDYYERYLYIHNKKMINATAGGAYIEGTDVMSLEEALAGYPDIDKAKAMEQIKQLKIEEMTEIESITAKFISLLKGYITLYENAKHAEKEMAKNDAIVKGEFTGGDKLNKIVELIQYVGENILDYALNNKAIAYQFKPYVIMSNREIHELDDTGEVVENIKAEFEIAKKIVKIIKTDVEKTLGLFLKAFQQYFDTNNIDRKLEDMDEFKDYVFLLDKVKTDLDEIYYKELYVFGVERTLDK